MGARPSSRTRADANRWLALAEADLSRGAWIDERAASVTFGEYARAVLRDSPKIGVRWRETCERNLRLHLAPLLDMPLRALSPSRVREWHAAALRGTGGRTSIAQSYRFMRMVMNTAVREGMIARNPCRIPGAGAVQSGERPVASPAQVAALVEAINPRYRTAVLIAAWCGLRRGEIAGLLVEDVDLANRTITVRRNRVEPLAAAMRLNCHAGSHGEERVKMAQKVREMISAHRGGRVDAGAHPGEPPAVRTPDQTERRDDRGQAQRQLADRY